MGKIVSAYATSHILFSPQAEPEMAAEIFQGMQGLGSRARDAKPDVILVITSDHLFNFDLAHQKKFSIGTADDYFAMGDMAIPQRPFKGHAKFAKGLIDFSGENDIEIFSKIS